RVAQQGGRRDAEGAARAAGAPHHRRRLGEVSSRLSGDSAVDGRARMAAHFDVVVIGSGAGGATLAQRLAPTGKKILILERGEHLPREPENWSPKAVFIQHRYRTQERWF